MASSSARSAAMAAAAARAKARAASRDGGRASGGGRGSLGAADVDVVKEDESKSMGENARAFMKAASGRSASKTASVANLNALAKMWERRRRRKEKERVTSEGKGTEGRGAEVPDSFSVKEIMLCLRIPLSHESVEVRATALRTLRCVMSEAGDAIAANLVNLQHLVVRCLDIDLDNQIERLQVIRLARKMLFLAPANFPAALVRSLVSIADGDHKETDRLRIVCLAVLCELSVANSSLFVACGGVCVLTRALLDTSMARIAEAVLGSLLRLIGDPETRVMANVNLDVAVAPLTEFRYVHDDRGGGGKGNAGEATGDREHRRNCAFQVILSILRSWPGLIDFANPKLRKAPTPLQTLVETLNLPNTDVRNMIMNLFFDALCLPRPAADADSYALALNSISPSAFRDGWKLAEGFVASEGLDILPGLTKTRPNFVDTHRAVVVASFLNARLPEALVEVIVTSELPRISVMATVLLGELLHLCHLLLPPELNLTGHCLPSLLQEVASTDPLKSNRASEAVNALHTLHSMKMSGPEAHSLFLEQILQESGCFQDDCFAGDRMQLDWQKLQIHGGALASASTSNQDEKSLAAIAGSKVLDSRDATTWDWDLVAAALRNPPVQTMDGTGGGSSSSEVAAARQFTKRISDFLKPSNNLFAKVELKSRQRARSLARVGCLFCDLLVRSRSAEGTKFLDEFVIDVKSEMNLFLSSTSPQDCLFSQTRIATTVCQYYFLFLGRISRSAEGRTALDRHQVLHCLYELCSLRSSDLYLKLILSSLDYSASEWGSRNLLEKALREGAESARLYATRFLGLLIRSRAPNVTQWVMRLLVSQLSDKSRVIPWVALDLLSEACDDRMNLEAVICALKAEDGRDGLDSLGAKGALLKTQLLASASGFRMLSETGFLAAELAEWSAQSSKSDGKSARCYVTLVEEMLSDGFTRHQKNDERVYGGRRSHEAHSVRNVFAPPHLYGMLAATEAGLELLFKERSLREMFSLLKDFPGNGAPSAGNSAVAELKAAVWAVCSVAATPLGVALVEGQEGVLAAVVAMAERAASYPLRGTAVYALSLVASTRKGARLLSQLGWCSLRSGRGEKWPVMEEWFANQLVTVRMQYDQMAAATVAETAPQDRQDTATSPLAPLGDDDFDDEDGIQVVEHRSFSFSYSPVLRRVTTASAPSAKNRSSLSRRKRLSEMFRSFSLGKRSSIDSSDSSERRSVGKSARGRRLLFGTSSSLETKDDVRGRKSRSASETVEEESAAAPIATLDTAEDLDKIDRDASQIPTTSKSPAAQSQPPPPSSQSHSKKLSPIASMASIATAAATTPSVPPKRRSKEEPTPPPPPISVTSVLRSGHRCSSESEAGVQQQHRHSNPLGLLLPPQPPSGSHLAPGPSVTSVSSVGSWTDNPGYMTLRSIHSRRRPLLVGRSVDSDGGNVGSNGDVAWANKSRSLDWRGRRGRPRLPSLTRSEGTSALLPLRSSGMVPLMEETAENPLLGASEPRYRGIALPLKFDALFPERDPAAAADEVGDVNSAARRPSEAQRMKAVTDKVDDWLQSHPSYDGLELHTAENCLACFALDPATFRDRMQERGRLPSTNSEANQPAARAAWNQGSPLLARRGLRRDSATGVLDEDLGSPGMMTMMMGSAQSPRSESGRLLAAAASAASDSFTARLMQRKEVLKLIGCMNATVGMVTAEAGLLKLKQRFPSAFQDLCLYSEVCLMLANHSYRLSVRRFVQELFLDLNYNELHEEPRKLLGIANMDNNDDDARMNAATGEEASSLGPTLHVAEMANLKEEEGEDVENDVAAA